MEIGGNFLSAAILDFPNKLGIGPLGDLYYAQYHVSLSQKDHSART